MSFKMCHSNVQRRSMQKREHALVHVQIIIFELDMMNHNIYQHRVET